MLNIFVLCTVSCPWVTTNQITAVSMTPMFSVIVCLTCSSPLPDRLKKGLALESLRGLCSCIRSVNNLFQSIRGVSDLVDRERLIYRSNLEVSISEPSCQVSLPTPKPRSASSFPALPRVEAVAWVNIDWTQHCLLLGDSHITAADRSSTLLTSAVYLAALLKLVRLCS